jgi:hypothetical protein
MSRFDSDLARFGIISFCIPFGYIASASFFFEGDNIGHAILVIGGWRFKGTGFGDGFGNEWVDGKPFLVSGIEDFDPKDRF